MSLTAHLRWPDSPIRAFLAQSFPIIQLSKRGSPNAKEFASFLGFDVLPLCSLPTLAPKGHAGTIGTAVDYRFRYYFQSYDAHETVAATGIRMLGDDPLGKLGRKFLDHQNELVARISPAGRQLDVEDEAVLNANCVILTLFEQIYRIGEVYPPLDLLPRRAKINDLLALAQPDVVQDISQLSYAFVSDAKELFKANAILNPTFQGSSGVGGADADIIVDKTLIEFKCTSKVDATKLRDAALQLLGYVLLDYDDEHSISDLAVYLPRQRYSWHMPLWKFILPPEAMQETLKCSSTPNMDVVTEQLRKRRKAFQKVVNSLPG